MPGKSPRGRKKNLRVLTWGAFDLLHRGHMAYLTAARALGDHLTVAVYSDSIVRQDREQARPFVPQKERMEILAAMECVDQVIPLNHASPVHLIETVRPDIIACGSALQQRLLSKMVLPENVQVIPIKKSSRQSTTRIIKKIRKAFPS